MSIGLTIDTSGVDRLAERIRRFGELDRSSLMEAIAFEGENQTRRRIAQEKTAPDGTPWPAWSADYAASRHGGQSLLVGDGDLLDSVTSDATADSAEWGSNLVYFAIHNYGGTADMAPGPAAIPQRQSLGLSPDNEADIETIIDDWHARQLEGL